MRWIVLSGAAVIGMALFPLPALAQCAPQATGVQRVVSDEVSSQRRRVRVCTWRYVTVKKRPRSLAGTRPGTVRAYRR